MDARAARDDFDLVGLDDALASAPPESLLTLARAMGVADAPQLERSELVDGIIFRATEA